MTGRHERITVTINIAPSVTPTVLVSWCRCRNKGARSITRGRENVRQFLMTDGAKIITLYAVLC